MPIIIVNSDLWIKLIEHASPRQPYSKHIPPEHCLSTTRHKYPSNYKFIKNCLDGNLDFGITELML